MICRQYHNQAERTLKHHTTVEQAALPRHLPIMEISSAGTPRLSREATALCSAGWKTPDQSTAKAGTSPVSQSLGHTPPRTDGIVYEGLGQELRGFRVH